MGQITARDVADWMIWKAYEQPSPLNRITNKKVQKLVYYAQAWHLANTGKPLFEAEIQAWVHGPVVPNLYQAFKQFGFNPIVAEIKAPPAAIDGDTFEFLEEVWTEYGGYDADYLESLTHHEPPWQMARATFDAGENDFKVIKHDWMMNYYRSLLAELSFS